MGSYSNANDAITLQMVAIPYPGRGHINQMLNFCKSVSLKRPNFLITFVVTEEWLGLLGSDPDDHRRSRNIRFATIPNVVPSEKVRAGDHMGFVEAVFTKMEGPVERLLDRLEPPEPRVIVYDSFVKWVLGVARRRDIPAASLWPMSATQFTLLYHWDTLVVNGQLPVNPLEHGEHNLTCIPGIPSTRIADIPKVMLDGKSPVIQELPKLVHLAAEADYLIFASVYELESEAIDSLKKHVPSQIYTTGLAIPSLDGKEIETSATSTKIITNDHVSWLDAQPRASVLYISQGSFLSASPEQLEEFVAGVCQSGIRFFWVARENLYRFREQIDRECGNGLVVSWCDQLRVLCHPSIGGFWSHCGWNSAKEAAFSGVPVLASPISFDQFTNRRQIVEDWRTGWRLMGDDDGRLVKRDEIASVLKRFMDSERGEVKEMRKRAVEISEICKNAGSEFGSSELQIEAFIRDISSIEVQKQN